jgi:hypothetical protein
MRVSIQFDTVEVDTAAEALHIGTQIARRIETAIEEKQAGKPERDYVLRDSNGKFIGWVITEAD